MNKIGRNDPCWCRSNKKYKNCCYPEKKPEQGFISHEPPPDSEGTQPIKVLEHNILSYFQKTHTGFKDQLIYDTDSLELKKGIKYINKESNITDSDIAYVNMNKQIHIQETYLSYVWIISYCLVTIFDEHILAPRLNPKNFNDPFRLQEKMNFFNYGLSLIKSFSTWDINKFPNPQKYAFQDKHNIERTNSVFLHAINFVLCHEYSHFSLGHVDAGIEAMIAGTNISDTQHKQDEIAADERAINLMLTNLKTKKIKGNKAAGIVAGLSSLLFLSPIGHKEKYPDPEIRLKTALKHLDLKDEDSLWGVASLALKMWTHRQDVSLRLPPIVETYKECFDIIVKEIAIVKKSIAQNI